METYGPLGDGRWIIKGGNGMVDVKAVYDENVADCHSCTLTKSRASELRDFARNLERAADYLEGK